MFFFLFQMLYLLLCLALVSPALAAPPFAPAGPDLPPATPALEGFDCNHQDAEVSKISLTSIAPCPQMDITGKSENITAQVLMRPSTFYIPVMSCKVVIDRIMYYCGAYSHNKFISRKTFHKTLTREECDRLTRFGEVRLYGKLLLAAINTTTNTHLVIAGEHSEQDGTCALGTLEDWDGSFKEVTAHAYVTILPTTFYTKVDASLEQIHLPDGLNCAYRLEHCKSLENGVFYWDSAPLTSDCSAKQFMVLHEGAALLLTGTEQDFLFRYIVVDDQTSMFALRLRHSITLCGRTLYTTEHSNVYVFQTESKNDFFFESLPIEFDQSSFISNFASKLQFLEYQIKTGLQKLHLYGAHRRCLLQRSLLQLKIALIRSSPTHAALTLYNEPRGVQISVLGEAALVVKCVQVQTFYRFENSTCFDNLPVTYSGQDFFLNPVTRILSPHANPISCSRIHPVAFEIQPNRWFGFSPIPEPLHAAPQKLEPTKEDSLGFEKLSHVAGKGLFSTKDLEDFARSLAYSHQKMAINAEITHRIIHNSGNKPIGSSFSPLSLFTNIDFRKIADSTLSHIWSFFTSFGLVSSTFIGIAMIAQMIKYALSVGLRVLHLKTEFGCSFYLISALWSALTTFLIHKQIKKQNNPEQMHPTSLPLQSLLPRAPSPAAPPSGVSPVVSVYPDLPNCVPPASQFQS